MTSGGKHPYCYGCVLMGEASAGTAVRCPGRMVMPPARAPAIRMNNARIRPERPERMHPLGKEECCKFKKWKCLQLRRQDLNL
jgi:hypothetical protein